MTSPLRIWVLLLLVAAVFALAASQLPAGARNLALAAAALSVGMGFAALRGRRTT